MHTGTDRVGTDTREGPPRQPSATLSSLKLRLNIARLQLRTGRPHGWEKTPDPCGATGQLWAGASAPGAAGGWQAGTQDRRSLLAVPASEPLVGLVTGSRWWDARSGRTHREAGTAWHPHLLCPFWAATAVTGEAAMGPGWGQEQGGSGLATKPGSAGSRVEAGLGQRPPGFKWNQAWRSACTLVGYWSRDKTKFRVPPRRERWSWRA